MDFNKYLWRNKVDLFISIFFSFLQSIPNIGIMLYLGIIFDSLFVSIQENNFDDQVIYKQTSIFIGIALLEYFLFSISQFFSARFNSSASKIIRTDVFKALQEKSHKYFDEENTGNLVAKATGDVANIINFFYVLTAQAGLMVGQFISIIGLLFYIDTNFGLIGLIFLPLLLISIKFFERQYNPLELASREKYGELSSAIVENIDNSILTRIFNSEKKNITRLNKLMRELKDVNILKKKKEAVLNVQENVIIRMAISILFIIGGLMVIDSQMTIGQLITSLFLAEYFGYPVMYLIQFIVFRSSYKVSERRLSNILAFPPHINNPIDGFIVDNKNMHGQIEFNNVCFGYNDNLVIENIDLSIEKNSTLAILGASGSGKSALINLIPRFYDANEGVIKIDDRDIKEFDIDSLRHQIGFIDQETFLFSRSIRENIAFGKPNAELDEIIEIAKITQMHNFIDSLPEKYDTVIGERGVTLSGGQRQRISIARALLLNPKIIIFDDSLSAVDIKTEHKIQSALELLLKNRTVIFITQRLSRLMSTDMNIILSHGKIIERGTHDELIDKNGLYKKLFDTQIDDILDLSILGQESNLEVLQND